jgi:hypothetical protein
MQRQNVLQDQLRGIPLIAICVPLIVEADHVVPFGKQTFGPAAKATE